MSLIENYRSVNQMEDSLVESDINTLVSDLSNKLSKSGDTLQGNLNCNNTYRLTSLLINPLPTPLHPSDAATTMLLCWRLRSIQFTEYHESVQGHYDWHNDVLWGDGTPVHRKLSMVIQLSDPSEYEGANLELKPFYLNAPNETMLKQQGTIIVFPSIVEHRVTPIIKGTRYSLVAWMEGPKWR
jgi:predicted 2-oxoglutarate/Fe(II)-dependent dioxygenase YbiX